MTPTARSTTRRLELAAIRAPGAQLSTWAERGGEWVATLTIRGSVRGTVHVTADGDFRVVGADGVQIDLFARRGPVS